MKRKFLILIIPILLTTCKKFTLERHEIVFFEVEQANYAWGKTHNGFFIDNMGTTRTYNLPQKWNYPNNNNEISDTALESNLSKTTKGRQVVKKTELAKRVKQLESASNGEISKRVNVSYDAGGIGYYGYLYDDSRKVYKRILLKEEGDVSCENTSNEAKTLTRWLKKIK